VATLKAGRLDLDRRRVLAVGNSLAAPYVAETTRRALNRCRVTSPVRHGVLRASHSMSMRVRLTAVIGRVEARAKYAQLVHNGTRPHIIRARRATHLAFYWKRKGRFVVAKQVRHPGTRPRPWMFRSLIDVAIPRGFVVRRTVTYRSVG